ncbi:hypothetical protein OROHE_004776 [Orobanche hederae]
MSGGGCGFWSRFLIRAARGQSEGEIWTAGFANGPKAHCRNFESCHMAAAATCNDPKRGSIFLGLEYSFGGLKREGWWFHVHAVISRNLIHMSSDEKNKEEDLNFLPLLGKTGNEW